MWKEEGGPIKQIQLTGFKKKEKEVLAELLLKLDCVFIDSEQYRNCTHLIAKQLSKSEKFLAACAAGKWILTKDYIINSVESGRWLDETTYEWGYKIERDSHYSPQTQSAPKRWREELTCSGALGAFHRWKVVLLIKEGDKRRDSITRVLEAGKAVICPPQKVVRSITHVFTDNKSVTTESEKHLFEAPYYPVQYIGDYLFENEIQNITEDIEMDNLLAEQEARDTMSDMELVGMKSALIKHMYFTQVRKKTVQTFEYKNVMYLGSILFDFSSTNVTDKIRFLNISKNCIMYILEGLVEGHFFPDVITELSAVQKYSIPPVQLLHSLLEHMLQGNIDTIFSAKFFHILYILLQLDPPWKSHCMLRYYLEFLQCPTCRRGTWSLVEMLVRSCLYCESFCHAVFVSENKSEQKMVYKTLLKFFFNLVKGEVQALTTRLCEGANSQLPRVMPETVLQKTFWLGNETSVLFTKQINILVDWVIRSHREKYKTNDVFKGEVAVLLTGILGTIVEYWILSGFIMDRNVLNQVGDDLANYIAISCDDFSAQELNKFICSISSFWLQMFVAEAVFKNLCLQRNITISAEPLSLHKILCSYLPALGEVGMCETGKLQKVKKKKIGQWPCSVSQRALLMLNGDKQNQAKLLPDLPELIFSKFPPLSKKLRMKVGVEVTHTKENRHPLNEEMHFYKTNIKGETALHLACIRNKVERLVQLLSFPGTDINVKDYAGWTPLHEACNHGSTVCVREILQRCPEVDLLSQVDGVTPLHDALSNGHVEIGKLLLQYGGPLLLQQRDFYGKLPLDYVASLPIKQELLNIVHPEETVEDFHERVEKDFQSQQSKLWFILFNKMLLNFCLVYNLSSPFHLSFKDIAYLNSLQLMAVNDCNLKSTDWLIDLYVGELHTFQKLPEFIQEISENLKVSSGEQIHALLATLETMAMTTQLSTSHLSNS
uniref:SMC5-SMC6 complex localization factor 1 n=1 Tax=Pelusios castaneus TaxID=367368 RepID=A0A8C8VKH5_9SAUR